MKQLELWVERRGGKRKGAGRKCERETPLRRHEKRQKMSRSNPLHITLRLIGGLPSLRSGKSFNAVRDVFAEARDRNGMRIVHYSVQSNHMHLIVEAESRDAVARGMNGLQVRLVKRLNKLWDRRGSIFADRYHDEVIKSPRQMRNTLRYVLQNARHHELGLLSVFDPCSSAVAFDGWASPSIPARGCWAQHLTVLEPAIPTVVPASAWLLTTGWKRHGWIGVREFPRAHG